MGTGRIACFIGHFWFRFFSVGLVEGSWVYGYFRDGENCQEALVLGSIPVAHLSLADTSKGFNDPNGVYPKYKNESGHQ